jgi:esterase/lipase superfamily enzyme
VSIPRDHRLGILEAPCIWKLEFRPNPAKHVVLLNVARETDDEFYTAVSGRVRGSARKEALVFVHGYNVTFEDAARRTAQLAYDLAFDGAAILYSWPSKGDLGSYVIDETNVEWTTPHLESFLSDLAAKSQARTIHLIAHSMGNRALASALGALTAKRDRPLPCFSQLVLTAPDIDADSFRQVAHAFRSAAERTTLYASVADKALQVSKKFHGYPRAGDCMLCVPGIDTIDASAVDTGLIGHSYYGSSRSVLSDLFWLLREGRPPEERFGMRVVDGPEGAHYAFRP